MPNRRRRKARNDLNIIKTINSKSFIILVIVLLCVIISCIGISIFLHSKEMEKIAEEKERIKSHVEDIYTSAEMKIDELNNYKSNSIIRIPAVGDILLGSNMKKYGMDENGLYTNIFSDITKYTKDADFVLGTYETSIKEDTKVFANAIKESNINMVTLAHNHALDDGEEGLANTKDYLNEIGIETIGIYEEESSNRVKIKEEKNAKIAFLSYTYDNNKKGVNIYNEDIIKKDLEYAKENADFSIVLMHWGDVNKNYANEEQKSQAQFLVDNGADIIIGSHPSALQEMEIIKNKDGKDCLVAYSLGDYTSDFQTDISNLEIILNLELYYDVDKNEMSIYRVDYIPLYMNDYGETKTKNRYKILDIKDKIANYGENEIDKKTYDKLIKGIDKIYNIIGKKEEK